MEKFATDSTFEKAQKNDPLKHVLRSYFAMEEDKDNRVFGAMDGAIQREHVPPGPGAVVPRFTTAWRFQIVDDVRHPTIQMNRKRLYMNHCIDPAGFDITEKTFSNCYAGTIGRQLGEGCITGDAISATSVYVTTVAETGFTGGHVLTDETRLTLQNVEPWHFGAARRSPI